MVQPKSRDLMPSAPMRHAIELKAPKSLQGSKMLSQQALNVLKKSIGTTSSLPMYKSKKKPVSRSLAKKAIESMKARSSSA
jgi:hypothetical protein